MTPEPKSASLVVPPGYALVPIKPTRCMLVSVDGMHDDKYVARGRAIDAWRRMLAAASPPPGASVAQAGEPSANFKCIECGWIGYTPSNCPKCAGEVNTHPAALTPPAAPQEPSDAQMPSVCDGKEQIAFEEWATRQRFDMTEHPMFYLFPDAKTNAAREAWKAAITYCRAAMKAQPLADGLMGRVLIALECSCHWATDREAEGRMRRTTDEFRAWLSKGAAGVPPSAAPQRWAVFCKHCRKEWSVDYEHPGGDVCEACAAGVQGTEPPMTEGELLESLGKISAAARGVLGTVKASDETRNNGGGDERK